MRSCCRCRPRPARSAWCDVPQQGRARRTIDALPLARRGPQCQKCNRLHPLSAFTGNKCCCDAKLAALRKRRNVNAAAAAAAAAPTAEPVADSPLAFFEEFLDQAFPAVTVATTGSTASPPAAWPWELPQHATAVLKFAGSPSAAFAPPGVRAQLLPAGLAVTDVPEVLHGAVRPGCTLLSLDAMLASEPGGAAGTWLSPGADGAVAVLKALVADSPCLAAQARLPGGVRLMLPGSAAVAHAAPLQHWWEGPTLQPIVIATSAPSSAMLRVSPLAVLSTVSAELLLRVPPAAVTADARVWVRINGQYVAAKPAQAAIPGELRVVLPPTGVSGCAVVELELGEEASVSCGVLLLCTDASVAAELATHATARATGADAVDELERAVWAVGCVLALSEQHVARNTTRAARYAITAAGAATAIRMGWLHSLHACIATAAASEAVADPYAGIAHAMAPVLAAGSGACMLHQAVASHSAVMLQATLRAPRVLRGTALTPDASGTTPLHAAVRVGLSSLIELLCATDGNDDLAAEGADAVLGWFTVRDANGATPFDLSSSEMHGVLGSRLKAGVALARAAVAAVPADRGMVRVEHAAAAAVAQLAQLAPDGSDTSRIAKALLLQASMASELKSHHGFAVLPTPPTSTSLHALRTTLTLLLVFRIVCVVMGPHRFFSDAEIRAALPGLSWEHWQSMPTVMCCHSSVGGLDMQTAQTVFAGLLYALAFLPGSALRLRAGRVAFLHCAVIIWVLVINPCICALRTYARYGTGLRQPWQGGLRQLAVLASVHVSTDMRPPKAAYFAILVLRGTAPLITRMLEDIIQLRVLGAVPAWDAMHLVLAFACMAHYVKVQQQRQVLHVAFHTKAAQPLPQDYKAKMF